MEQPLRFKVLSSSASERVLLRSLSELKDEHFLTSLTPFSFCDQNIQQQNFLGKLFAASKINFLNALKT